MTLDHATQVGIAWANEWFAFADGKPPQQQTPERFFHCLSEMAPWRTHPKEFHDGALIVAGLHGFKKPESNK